MAVYNSDYYHVMKKGQTGFDVANSINLMYAGLRMALAVRFRDCVKKYFDLDRGDCNIHVEAYVNRLDIPTVERYLSMDDEPLEDIVLNDWYFLVNNRSWLEQGLLIERIFKLRAKNAISE